MKALKFQSTITVLTVVGLHCAIYVNLFPCELKKKGRGGRSFVGLGQKNK